VTLLASYEPNLIADSGITLITLRPFPTVKVSTVNCHPLGILTSVEAAHATRLP
jgi:hypothetical protein